MIFWPWTLDRHVSIHCGDSFHLHAVSSVHVTVVVGAWYVLTIWLSFLPWTLGHNLISSNGRCLIWKHFRSLWSNLQRAVLPGCGNWVQLYEVWILNTVLPGCGYFVIWFRVKSLLKLWNNKYVLLIWNQNHNMFMSW